MTIGSDTALERVSAVARQGEMITSSMLSREYAWPADDPRLRPRHNEIPVNDRIRNLVTEAAETNRFDASRFRRRFGGEAPDNRLLELLNHRAFQFNSRELFRASPLWRNRITAAVREDRPVEVVLPVFCVIANPVKRIEVTLATAAEDVALLHLGRLTKHAEELCGVRLTFDLIADSTFYSPAFGVTSVESKAYINHLRRRLVDLGLDSDIRLYDISDLLADSASEFQRRYDAWFARLQRDPLADGISDAAYNQWLSSMAASVNVRKLDLSYEVLRSALSEELSRVPESASLFARARSALDDYRAVKLAASDLGWEDRYFPGALRATIHTKPVPVLGLRLYPEYKFRSRLLPYHGIGILYRDEKRKKYELRVEPEMFVYGRPEVTRVLDSEGRTYCYLEDGRVE
ncbi:L-tyrosine/L-tryptophan isonitrile synthase family protein [Nocardia sp. CDC159]|uniref:L-tyrosine/L-tryptophan isonitrile synthase family protein n=1 Tax=Nocardia pulmonis TaxID=2951408 RepID=A0A9X2J0U8_9NOCA|nr:MULTISPECIES: L-tyrosine/L-tryptophan isonitrile synthase family protein [Nocardia]MCM6778943.1 L-tyrosine/L-tryptophan isonitrile synthase family protein [Nocardia pulmonis]MCM6791803.1 L-tyrosine/L-tryptophan isonitrile synthase family protein [Nocardia sp. CDC159]